MGAGRFDLRRHRLFVFTHGVHRGGFFAVRDGRVGTRNPPAGLGGAVAETPTAALGLVAALVLAGCVFLPPDKLIAAIRPTCVDRGPYRRGRAQLWAETMPLIKAYPAFGCGLGGLRQRS